VVKNATSHSHGASLALQAAKAADGILVKGSRGMQMELVVSMLLEG